MYFHVLFSLIINIVELFLVFQLIRTLYPLAWYDIELSGYQKERQETELEKMFEERNQTERVFETDHLRKKEVKQPETEWQKTVKSKKGEDYYDKLREVSQE